MWERLRRFSGLDGQARGAFLRAAALLPLISASLRFRGFRRTHATLQKRISGLEAVSSAQSMGVALLAARMVRAAARHGFGHPTCLEESLALWWLLGRQGISSALRIGVRKSDGRFEAHAWVESEGVALNEPEAMHEHYATFDAALASMPQGPA
jgi:hypothetical protein